MGWGIALQVVGIREHGCLHQNVVPFWPCMCGRVFVVDYLLSVCTGYLFPGLRFRLLPGATNGTCPTIEQVLPKPGMSICLGFRRET